MAWTAGALLFPIIPGIWELHAWFNRHSKSKAFLTTFDRLSLRTFAVGLAFLAMLLCIYPQKAFVSLSTRGDWMLDGIKDPRADKARHFLFAAAGGLEWLYKATKQNPYKAQIDAKARRRAEEAAKQREQEQTKTSDETPQRDKDLAKTSDEAQLSDKELANELVEQEAFQPGKKTHHKQKDLQIAHQPEHETAQPTSKWPWKGASLHRAVATMPASVETSIKSVAQYIAKQEPDPILRIKALHDYVADRIAYDSDAFYAGKYPDQEAETVFKTRKGVCAGYANLLYALASAIHEQVIVVTGNARDETAGDRLAGMGHAWNAAHIGKRWYLIDVTWDAGSISPEKGFTKAYSTDYFLPPAQVMIQDHFPELSTWQLLADPLSQGDFLRQPMLRAGFQEDDLALVAPKRARNEAESKAVVIVKNPKHNWLMAGLEQKGKEIGSNTSATNDETAQLVCPLPDKGTYRLNMFVNPNNEYGEYDCVGSVDFVSR
jgi:transglutaminase-like putative cysteine protease